MTEFRHEPGSFRDRTARIFYRDGEVYRVLDDRADDDWRALSATAFFAAATERRDLVRTEQVDLDATAPGERPWAAMLRHERIPFVSYPYEWTLGMLRDAALLQLRLLREALDWGLSLKDGTAYNVQWFGAKPVFIDIPSFHRLRPGTPWLGYRQFCETCLYPLLLGVYRGIPFQRLLRGRIDGIEPETCLSMMSLRDYFRAGVLKHVVLQAKAQARFEDTRLDVKDELETAGFTAELIAANVRQTEKLVRRLQVPLADSEWSDYVDCGHYGAADQESKERFVRRAVEHERRGLVWDLGCNTGTFSRIAAESADYVVALDADAASVERLYRELAGESRDDILPLVGHVADPSPARGWGGVERRSLPGRGTPDLVLCLALIHHVVISANVRMREFIASLGSLGADLVIEFVGKDDPMVQRLLRNKDDLYDDYELPYFESCLAEHFVVERREEISGGSRVLYHARNAHRPPRDSARSALEITDSEASL